MHQCNAQGVHGSVVGVARSGAESGSSGFEEKTGRLSTTRMSGDGNVIAFKTV